jgi:cephalosporin hydroxylase
VRGALRPDDRVMVLLDSDHAEAHVRKELDLYAPLVTSGCYLIVEDTNVNGHPVYPLHGPGPMEAVQGWLPAHQEFEADRRREKFMLTFNPYGYLRRK